jgi:hypothetical protein
MAQLLSLSTFLSIRNAHSPLKHAEYRNKPELPVTWEIYLSNELFYASTRIQVLELSPYAGLFKLDVLYTAISFYD